MWDGIEAMRAAAGLAAVCYLPGAAWSHVGAAASPSPAARGAARLLNAWARGAAIGVPIALLSAVALAECSLLSRAAHGAALAAIGGLGLLHRRIRHRSIPTSDVRAWAAGLAALTAGFLVILAATPRSEWIVGGWDPGIYTNHGVAIAASGTFYPDALPAYEALGRDGRELFSRGWGRYREAFPGSPIALETGRFDMYFFRLTPTLIALAALYGGPAAALRVNALVGLLAAFVFLAALRRLTGSRSLPWLAALMLIAHPLFLYHTHLPTSEMLQLFLFCAMAYGLAERGNGLLPAAGLSLLLFAAVVNRLSFFPFAGILLVLLALWDLPRADRRRVTVERAIQIAGAVLGAAFDLTSSAVTVWRLGKVVPHLLLVGSALAIAAMALDALGHSRAVRAGAARLHGRALGWTAAVALGALAAAVALHGALDAGPARELRALWPYFGMLTAPLAVAGLLVWLVAPDRAGSSLKLVLLFAAGTTAVLMVNSHIVEIYPWATRRWLPYTVPLLAIGAAAIPAWGCDRGGRWTSPVRLAALLLAAVLLGAQLRRGYHAWSHTEYGGVMNRLEAVAANIDDADVVVADHPWWGTPLTFIHGKQVLNGQLLWRDTTGTTASAGRQSLAGLAAAGFRIRFLTSTEEGLGIYALPITGAVLDWTGEPLTYREILHHKNARAFDMRERRVRFRIYTWTPPAP